MVDKGIACGKMQGLCFMVFVGRISLMTIVKGLKCFGDLYWDILSVHGIFCSQSAAMK